LLRNGLHFRRLAARAVRSGASAAAAVFFVFAGIATVAAHAAADGDGTAQGQSRATAFHDAALALYEAAKRDEPEELLRRLGEAENRLRALTMEEIRSAEGIGALADSLAEVKRAAAAVTADPQRRERAAAALWLAADELAHPDRPLWHRYRLILGDDIDRLERLAKEEPPSRRQREEMLAAYRDLAGHYRLIRTAALLRGEPWKVERGDSVLVYTERLLKASRPDPKLLEGLFPQLREAMAALFPAEADAPSSAVPVFVPPPWGFYAAIGSLILTVLAWNGWQRYRYGAAGGSAGRGGADGTGEGTGRRQNRR